MFSSHTELRAGVRSGGQSVDREIGTPGLPGISSESYGGLTMRYASDSYDRSTLWDSGTLARIELHGVEALGAVQSYDRLEAVATTSGRSCSASVARSRSARSQTPPGNRQVADARRHPQNATTRCTVQNAAIEPIA